MGRPRKAVNDPEQAEMFADVERIDPKKRITGRHSDMMAATLAAAAAKGLLEPEDDALGSLLLATGWALDVMEARNSEYGPAKLLPSAVEVIRELGLTPAIRAEASTDAFAKLVKALEDADNTDPDPSVPAEVPHAPES